MTRNNSDRRAMKQLKVAICQQAWGRTFPQKIGLLLTRCRSITLVLSGKA
jgi:hypothetical protein